VNVPDPLRRWVGDLVAGAWDALQDWGRIRPGSARARRFRAFGAGSVICFPVSALFGERYIEVGAGTIIGPYASLSAGISPAHELGDTAVVSIGNRCLIGKGTGIVGHHRIEIGDDVFTGHHVYITDANHGYEDPTLPIGHQFAPPRPVRVGAGSWLGHGAIVLPGVTIGAHVVVGAGAVVTSDVPDYTVVVGNPARVVRRIGPAQPAAAGEAGEG